MFNTELLIYVAHLAFWAAFGVARAVTTTTGARRSEPRPTNQAAKTEEVAPWSRTVLAVHALAFGVMRWHRRASHLLPACGWSAATAWGKDQKEAAAAALAALKAKAQGRPHGDQ